MPDLSARPPAPESLLESLVPLMAQAGSVGDAAVLLLERLVARASCTAGWIGRITPNGHLAGLAEVDVGIAPTSVTVGGDNPNHPLWRAAMHADEAPRVLPLRELGMDQAAIVPLPVLEPTRFAIGDDVVPQPWGVMALAVVRPPTHAELELWHRIGRSLGGLLARIETNAVRLHAASSAARDRTLLKDVLEHLPDAIVITDAETRVVLENERARALFRTPSESASEGLRRATELNNLLLSSFLSRTVLRGSADVAPRDITLVSPTDGSDLTFEVLSVTLSERGREPLTVSLLRNVTDLKRVTEALTVQFARARDAERVARNERDRLDLILENVADPVIVMDMGANLLRMNRAAERLFQSPEPAGPLVAERSARAFAVRANDTIFTSFVSDFALDTSTTRRTSFRLMDPEKKEHFPVEALAGKIAGERGEPVAIVTVLHDLSAAEEKAKLAEQLLVLNRDLEGRVAVATSELEERSQRLELQRDELRRASQLKSDFLASMSHELRTPLNAIIGHTLNMIEGLYGPQAAPAMQILGRIEQNSRHLLALISDILDLSRIEAGQMPMSVQPVEIAALVEEVARTLEPMAQRRHLSLTIERSGLDPVIETDPVKLRQILMNLGSNAIKFTSRGSVRVSISGPNGDGASRRVTIAVEDTGCGIPREQIPEAFQDFRQLDQGYTRQEGGTGLGLPITRRLVGLLGGRLYVRSQPGVGSCFRVELPPRIDAHVRGDGDIVVIEDVAALPRALGRGALRAGSRASGKG